MYESQGLRAMLGLGMFLHFYSATFAKVPERRCRFLINLTLCLCTIMKIPKPWLRGQTQASQSFWHHIFQSFLFSIPLLQNTLILVMASAEEKKKMDEATKPTDSSSTQSQKTQGMFRMIFACFSRGLF